MNDDSDMHILIGDKLTKTIQCPLLNKERVQEGERVRARIKVRVRVRVKGSGQN